jgi:hypothetical protein
MKVHPRIAEDRDQMATGLELDLKKCFSEWDIIEGSVPLTSPI